VTQEYFAVAAAYAVFTVVLGAVEVFRIRVSGPDAITVFIVLFALECCVPGIGIFAALPLVDIAAPTGNWVIDRIYLSSDVTEAVLILELTIWFAFFFYLGASAGRVLLRRIFPGSINASYRLEAIEYRLILVLAGGLVLTLGSFFLSGDDIFERYANLIRLRAYSEDFERTSLNAYAFALTQTWGWIAIPALFVFYEKRGLGWLWWGCLISAVVFAVLNVSRRGFVIPIMLCYLAALIYDGRWRLRAILIITIPIIVWVAYGKEILSTVAFGGEIAQVVERYDSTSSALLRASSEQGLTIVESLGTFTYLDENVRLGIDHLMSIAAKLPYRILGFEDDFPKRMVRISTEAFATPENQDIPPGLFGQMWLDFRVLGAIVWGIFLGAQVSVVQFLFARCKRSLQSSALIALVVFLIALPINTGSYDFSASVDVFVTLAACVLAYRLRRATDSS
jgi:hypothetical protein